MVSEFSVAKFDEQMGQKTKQITNAQAERDLLMIEHRKSNMQAGDRAKLDVKRGDLKKKQGFIDRLCVSASYPPFKACTHLLCIVWRHILQRSAPTSMSMHGRRRWRAILSSCLGTFSLCLVALPPTTPIYMGQANSPRGREEEQEMRCLRTQARHLQGDRGVRAVGYS